MKQLFTKGWQNPKTAKGELLFNFITLILHLAPARLSGYEVCSSRSEGCTDGCLNTAGRGRMGPIQKARIDRTLMFFLDRPLFKQTIIKEIYSLLKQCDKQNKLPAVRMNGTSDLIWEQLFPELFTLFPNVQFYDYTKHVKRCVFGWALPNNYHLTFSRSESNQNNVDRVLEYGRHNVVSVFDKIPEVYNGVSVYNADLHDLRFLDPKAPSIGGLKAKGKAKHDTTGFVIR